MAGQGTHIHKNIHIKQTECAPKTLRRWCWQSSLPGALIHPHSCVVLQLISARTRETALISFHKSSICAFCSSAKECQVKLFGPRHKHTTVPQSPDRPLRHTQESKPVASCPPPHPSGNESHTGVIQLALGNRHLSLRTPLGTRRPIYEWGGGPGNVAHCNRHILTHVPQQNLCCKKKKKKKGVLNIVMI